MSRHRGLVHGFAFAAKNKDEEFLMGRLGALLKVMLAFVGFVAVPVEAAARRHRLQLVEDSIRQSVSGRT